METYAPCSLAVIAVTCGFSFFGFRDRAFAEKYIFRPEAILGWQQYYRLITSGFLHLDGRHLAMNMLTLYFFGPAIELNFGIGAFLLIYFGAILGGSLLSLYVHRHHDYRALGASGGVSGLVLAYIFLFPGGDIGMFFLPLPIPGWIYGIGYLTYSFYGMVRRVGNVGHDAHLGGSLTGMFIAAALHPDAVRHNLWLFVGMALGTALLVLYLNKSPLLLPMDGFDFTRKNPRLARPSRRFSPGRILEAVRGGSPPPAPTRADRRVDEILQKVSESGIHSLTEAEKTLLNSAAELQRRRAIREKPKLGFPF